MPGFALARGRKMIDKDLPVRVFKNWKHGCYSIMQRGVIKASAKQVRLSGVEFRVREAGRQRALRENRKNVHAFAVGQLVDYVHPSDPRDMEPMVGRAAFYDPIRFPSFVDRDTKNPVTAVSAAHFDEDGIVYLLDAA
jgi:hypothetical protein